jgi:hypothetical protein
MAGTITQTVSRQGSVIDVVLTCTADASDGSFPATALTEKISGNLIHMITNPGSTAPQSNYDITLPEDKGSIDALQGTGANRHASNSELAVVVYSGTSLHPVVSQDDTLTFTIANNNVNSAVVVATLRFVALY